jgi:site-specific recombinase XerD
MPEGGADIQLLGHAELSTTQIYIQVSIQQLKHAAPGP